MAGHYQIGSVVARALLGIGAAQPVLVHLSVKFRPAQNLSRQHQ